MSVRVGLGSILLSYFRARTKNPIQLLNMIYSRYTITFLRRLNGGFTVFLTVFLVLDSRYLTDGTLDNPVRWIPGLKDIQLRHVASFIQTTDPNDIILEFIDEQLKATSKASAVILYTFDTLEANMLDILSPLLPPVYTIGPLQPLIDQIPNTGSKFLDCSLLKAEEGCLKWLDSKEQNSVIYVNFGTIVVLTPDEVLELAWGLANSKNNFLWVIRPDLIKGDSGTLPTDFLTQTKGRGLIASWCPQEKSPKPPFSWRIFDTLRLEFSN